GRTKEKAQMTQCLSNLRQIGVGIKSYVDDNAGKFPLFGNKPWESSGDPDWEAYILGLGGYDADAAHRFMAAAIRRPLWPYIKPSNVFRCPADHGQEEQDFFGSGSVVNGYWKPTNFQTLGCSYCYNAAGWRNSMLQTTDEYGLSYKTEN